MTRQEELWGRRLVNQGFPRARRFLWDLVGERLARADGRQFRDLLKRENPDCFLTTDLNLGFGRGLVSACRAQGIPTVGNVFSWDHPFYEQRSRPDRLTCWSLLIRDWLVAQAGFAADRIEVTGAPAFDAYFDTEGVQDRVHFCESIGLDPSRPLLVFATLGYFRKHWDETGVFRALISAIERGEIPGQPQVILRLHPLSVDHHFEEFRGKPWIVFSRFAGYCPGMRWWPSRSEVILAGNILRHADVCLSPGSTMSIEAAIFDTPTLIPAFNPFFPEEFDRFFNSKWIKLHFRFVSDGNLIPLLKSPEEMTGAVCRALSDRSWLSAERRMIRERLLGPLDGQATHRLAQVVINAASNGAPRSCHEKTHDK
jgi:hypothetical protein